MKKLSIVIPCLNEKQTILMVVEDAKKFATQSLKDDFEIVVADNGSTDGTIALLENNSDIRLVHVPIRGYGAALHWGLLHSEGEYIIFGDADMSYPFLNLPKYIEAMAKEPDMVLGSRLKGSIEPGAMPFLNRYFGTPVLTFLIRLYYRIPTTDCNSGMRLVKRSFYEKLHMRNSGMEWASELLLKTALHQGKYIEFPIEFHKDRRNRPPHLSRWPDGWRHLKTIILLKPSILYPLLVIFPALAVLFYETSFVWTFLFLLFALGVALVLGANFLLLDVLDGKESGISKFLKKFALVQTMGILGLALFALIVYIPEEHLGTKLFITSVLNVLVMWVLLIETIKTQVASRLPDKSAIKPK
ncbi:MAG: glycosyltransferase family 2 protein [Bdellovibrionales bacterium]|nr:glycosyltransferase family 2 protein [Bdellovibrionales bacterium]